MSVLEQERVAAVCEIRAGTVADVFDAPDHVSLIEGYARESAISGMPYPNPQRELYERLEQSGVLDVFVACMSGQMVGFVGLITWVVPHYGVPMSTLESFYVARPFRRATGAGLGLLRAAEQRSQERDAYGMLVSAPAGAALNRILSHVGYRHSNTIHFKPHAAGHLAG